MSSPAPPPWRDAWAWVTAALVLPLFLFSRGTPRGEAVAEDFDFIRRALLEPSSSLLDGGGSMAFWRPIPHQIYYETLGSLILTHPALVAALHGLLMAVACVALYRVLRRHWSGFAAAAAASFPLLAESTRTQLCWPSQFVDVGAFLFAALAIHEAAFRRLWTSLAALLAALLCKEVTAAAALLIPFLPGMAEERPSVRIRWLVGIGAVLIAWTLAYLWVRQHAGLELPHGLERQAELLRTPLASRLSWAVHNSLRAAFSLSLRPGPADVPAAVAVLLLAVGCLAVLVLDRGARDRLRARRGWAAWAGVWCLLNWAALASIFPLWAPNRSQLGSLGFGVGAVAITSAAHPGLTVALVATRLGLFALAPRIPSGITPEAEDRGAFMDFGHLVRLQRLMRVSREQLKHRYPTLPHGATVGWHNLPLSSEYAFGGAHAVQSWYRDPTLAFIPYKEFESAPERPVTTFLSYQPEGTPEVVLVDPDALRWQLIGADRLRHGRWLESISALERADSLQVDRRAFVFRGDLAGRRAYCMAQLGRWREAEVEARRALFAAREDVGARYALALVLAARRELTRSNAQIDTLLAMDPGYDEARQLRGLIAQLGSRK